MDAGQPIMPINSSPYGQSPMNSQFNPQMAAQFQRQYAGGQQMGPMGMQSGRIPQDMIQQQMIMQMYQQQQQRQMQQIRPVGQFSGANQQQSPFFASPYGGSPQMGQPIQPYSPPQQLSFNGGMSPSQIPMQVIVGRQTPSSSAQQSDTQPIPAAFGTPLAGAAFQTEDQAGPQPQQQPQASESSLPKFLQGASQDAIDEFKRIIRTPNSTYAFQVKQIENLVSKLDLEKQELYKQFMKENDDQEQQHRDRIHSTVTQMSAKAQEQFAKISAVLRNPGVPDQERWDRVLNLYSKMDPELRNEFEQKFKGFNPLANLTPNYFI
ncbi:hypothetical protein Ddc_04700 [Ditylenchus destructor]|nr:hypothetical protein Ddc_04700 [Ditylenchus destructor]